MQKGHSDTIGNKIIDISPGFYVTVSTAKTDEKYRIFQIQV